MKYSFNGDGIEKIYETKTDIHIRPVFKKNKLTGFYIVDEGLYVAAGKQIYRSGNDIGQIDVPLGVEFIGLEKRVIQ